MSKGWFGDRQRHRLSSMGIRNSYFDLSHTIHKEKSKVINNFIDSIGLYEKIELYCLYMGLEDSPEDAIIVLGLDNDTNFIKHIENVIYNYIYCATALKEGFPSEIRDDTLYNNCHKYVYNTDGEVARVYRNHIQSYATKSYSWSMRSDNIEAPKIPENPDIQDYMIGNRKEY